MKRISKRPRPLLAIALLTGLLVTVPETNALAWNSQGQRAAFTIAEDRFWNYDFRGYGGNYEGNLDWHASLIFKNNAEIDLVKESLNTAYFNGAGGFEIAELDEGIGYFEDEDRGRKNEPGCPGYGIHYRIYADFGSDGDPNADNMFNPDWGHWVLGTTHFDENDGCSGYTKIFGTSEQAEGYIASYARNTATNGQYWAVFEDRWFLQNCASPSFPDCGVNTSNNYWRTEFDGQEYHRWESNGLVTTVDVN